MAETQLKGRNIGDRSVTDVDIDLSAAPAKTPVVDADSVIIVDLADNLTKRTLFSTIVTYLANTFVRSTSYTAADVLTKIKTVDGTTSGLDADLLDGVHLSSIVNYASGSDFVDGTLVRTSIPASASEEPSFVIEISGKSYSGNPPFKVIAQGYLYAGTIIAYSGISYGGEFAAYIKMFEDSGYLCFWWPRISYWNSFNVHARDANNGYLNSVVSISNSVELTGTKKVQVNLQRGWTSYNFDPTLKAPLASPAFTGSPTVWTPSTSDNSTRIASTEFVKAAIAALVASSPAALDTLNELAGALGNDPNFATTITNALAGKAASVHSHALISITDNRGGDRQPAYYFNYALSTFFNEAISGMGGWASGITVKGWHEAYNTWQLLGGSNTNSPGEWYFREGIASFGAVKRIWHSGNFDPATKLGINATAADSDKLDGKHASEFSASCYLVNQTTHGFSVGDAIKMSGSTWVKVIADSIANAGVSALVFSVTDANNFKYITSGLLTGAYTAGADYYSSTISAGALMTLSTPEVWTAGQVRQYIGTGVAGGLLIDIDAGDEIATSAFNDIYVTGMSFNNANRVLTLTRSASMPDLSIAIPFPEEEMGYEFRDITKGVAQTYVLDMKVSWPYTIKSIVCESDGTLTGVSVKINTTAVTGLSSLSVGTKAETSATAANVTVAGDVVTINTATSYSGTPTIMRLKIKYQRL